MSDQKKEKQTLLFTLWLYLPARALKKATFRLLVLICRPRIWICVCIHSNSSNRKGASTPVNSPPPETVVCSKSKTIQFTWEFHEIFVLLFNAFGVSAVTFHRSTPPQHRGHFLSFVSRLGYFPCSPAVRLYYFLRPIGTRLPVESASSTSPVSCTSPASAAPGPAAGAQRATVQVASRPPTPEV